MNFPLRAPKAQRQRDNTTKSRACSQVFSETSPKVTYAIAHNTRSTTSSEVLKTSHVAHMAHIIVSQETRMASVLAHGQKDGDD